MGNQVRSFFCFFQLFFLRVGLSKCPKWLVQVPVGPNALSGWSRFLLFLTTQANVIRS